MKVVIFAGGVGTRLWPLSRANSPKQFDAVWGGKSTLRLAVERLRPKFSWSDIFIQTVSDFRSLVAAQVPELSTKNILVEPARRNVGPAVCLGLSRLKQLGSTGPVAIIWADHLVKKPDEFLKKLQIGEQLILENPKRFVFLAEKARFANNNLGWLKVGPKTGCLAGVDYFRLLGWQYKPDQADCDRFFKSGIYYWNPGYFISSLDFILSAYQRLSPQIYDLVQKTLAAKNSKQAFEFYSQCPKLSFDSCLIEKTDLRQAVVLKTAMGWSDPGTLYALKEALQKKTADNVIAGQVFNFNTKDSLVYNLEKGKLVATVGLSGLVVVNTKDALLVVPKDQVKAVTDLVETLHRDGYKKYL